MTAMPPIILTVLQALFLLLLYVFVARAVRAVLKDVSPASTRPRRPRPAAQAGPAAKKGRRKGGLASGAQSTARQRSEQPPRIAPREIVVHSPTGAPRVIGLGAETITFGRNPASTVTLDDPYISDRHARVYNDGKRWLVADEGSTNGTFLNQVKVSEPTPIAAGDQLGIGKTVVEVRK